MKLCRASGPGWACDRSAKSKGLCQTHYMQEYKGRPLAQIRVSGPKECNYGTCKARAVSYGLCNAHRYQREQGIELRPVNRTRYNGARCAADGCLDEAKKKGLCGRHYQMERRKTLPTCVFIDCDAPQDHFLTGLCSGHRSQHTQGRPLTSIFRRTVSLQASNGLKVCSACEKQKPVTDFAVREQSADGYQHKCRACQRKKILKNYQITQEEYEEILRIQGGGCAICGTESCGEGRSFAIDHDHECCSGTKSCGRCIRGLLCRSCNAKGLSWYEALPPSLRTFALLNEYLTDPPAEHVLARK